MRDFASRAVNLVPCFYDDLALPGVAGAAGASLCCWVSGAIGAISANGSTQWSVEPMVVPIAIGTNGCVQENKYFFRKKSIFIYSI